MNVMKEGFRRFNGFFNGQEVKAGACEMKPDEKKKGGGMVEIIVKRGGKRKKETVPLFDEDMLRTMVDNMAALHAPEGHGSGEHLAGAFNAYVDNMMETGMTEKEAIEDAIQYAREHRVAKKEKKNEQPEKVEPQT